MTDGTALDIQRDWLFERIWKAEPQPDIGQIPTQTLDEFYEQNKSTEEPSPVLMDECHVIRDQMSYEIDWDRLLREQLNDHFGSDSA